MSDCSWDSEWVTVAGTLNEWLQLYTARCEYPPLCCSYSAVWLLHGWCHVKPMHLIHSEKNIHRIQKKKQASTRCYWHGHYWPHGHMHLIHSENNIHRIQRKNKPRPDVIDMVIIGQMYLVHSEKNIYRVQKKKQPRSDVTDMAIIGHMATRIWFTLRRIYTEYRRRTSLNQMLLTWSFWHRIVSSQDDGSKVKCLLC